MFQVHTTIVLLNIYLIVSLASLTMSIIVLTIAQIKKNIRTSQRIKDEQFDSETRLFDLEIKCRHFFKDENPEHE